MLQVRGTGLRLIEGVVADHLKDGRSVRVDFEMTILDKAAQGAADHAEPAVVHPELRPVGAALRGDARRRRAAIHLASAARDAEAWCLENMAIPLTALGRFARDLPFWVRVEYRVQDQPPPRPTPSRRSRCAR